MISKQHTVQQRQQMTLHHGPSQISTIGCRHVEKTPTLLSDEVSMNGKHFTIQHKRRVMLELFLKFTDEQDPPFLCFSSQKKKGIWDHRGFPKQQDKRW